MLRYRTQRVSTKLPLFQTWNSTATSKNRPGYVCLVPEKWSSAKRKERKLNCLFTLPRSRDCSAPELRVFQVWNFKRASRRFAFEINGFRGVVHPGGHRVRARNYYGRSKTAAQQPHVSPSWPRLAAEADPNVNMETLLIARLWNPLRCEVHFPDVTPLHFINASFIYALTSDSDISA